MSTTAPACDSRHLVFASTLAEVDIACDQAQRFLSSKPALGNIFFIMLALREALTNAVLHGNRSDPNLSVECLIRLCENELVMTIRDQGRGFDWRGLHWRLPSPESVSGRGLPIIKTCFDRIEFNETGNEITFRKTLTLQGGSNMPDILQDGSKTVMAITDDLVGSRIETIRNQLTNILEQGVTALEIDMAGVQTVDSLGMGLLVATHNSLKARRGRLSLINVDPRIHDVLTIMGLDKHFSIRQAQ